jgi:hypothetical protein
MTREQMNTITEFVDLLCKQIDKINKKGDITPDELTRMDKAIDIVKDCSVICAMEEYGQDPEGELYPLNSLTGYYGRNSRTQMPMWSSQGRDSMGRYSSSMGYSRDDGAKQTMRHDLEMKLANARNEEERHMYMRMMDALNG